MGKMSNIHQQATEVIDEEMGEVPDYVREDAIIAEAQRILMERKGEGESNDCV